MTPVYTWQAMMRMRTGERIVNRVLKLLIQTICKLDAKELRRISKSGPAILITNHTTNIEGPAVYILIQPRQTTGLGKIELWQNRITRFLMKTWGIIPVHRGRVDSAALRASLRALKNGSLLGVAPEGTRSKTGNLKRGEKGAALLAVRSGAPVYPSAQWGFRDIPKNLKRLRRTPVTIRVGRPFTVTMPPNTRPSAASLRQIADEMMYQIALLLPARYRGVYSDLSVMTTDYLQFQR
jgi:1-acyl-sn-glycerol-3-phosphate acyltransferase